MAVHRVHGLLLWTILVTTLLAASVIGLVIGVAFAKAPPDPIARTSPSPGTSPTRPPAITNSVSLSSLIIRPPDGWQVTEKKDTSIELVGSGGGGLVFFQSDKHQPAEPAAQIVTEITAATARKYPDVRTCLVPVSLAVNGPSGSVFALCYTFIPQAGRAYPATDLFWVAANRNGSVFYLYEVFAPAETFNDFNRRADPLIRTVVWKLS